MAQLAQNLASALRLRAPILLPVIAALLGAGFLWLYIRTAAPSVLSGDSAEFQFAALLLAVPHPTGYPLYILLGHLATQIPGDAARRVTQVSALCGAACVVVLFLLTARLSGSPAAALLAALACGLGPGLWNAATLAEVYALNALLVVALGLALAHAWQQAPGCKPQLASPRQQAIGDRRPVSESASGRAVLLPALCALLGGLGISHHSSFLFSAAPWLAAYGLIAIRRSATPFTTAVALAGGGLLGLAPWLFPLVQYARFGPFSGESHGLPHFYFWGAPTSWAEALAHLSGGRLREDVAQPPTLASLWALAQMLGERMWFEFGPLGLLLGLLGGLVLWRHNRGAWAASAWLVLGTCLFLALLGPAVQDAPVFTLPIVPAWALWIGFGGLGLARWSRRIVPRAPQRATTLVLAICLACTLAWGTTRRPFADKAHLWVFRSFGEQMLAALAPEAVLITRWEQGTILLYLQLVEGQRADVWVDLVEPGDEAWAERARRYAGRPVYVLGSAADLPGERASLVLPHEYASLLRLEAAQGP